MVMLANVEPTVINGPHLFLISLGKGRDIDTRAVNAMTWQEAVLSAAIELLELDDMTIIMREEQDPATWIAKFPTIASLQDVLWEDKVSLNVSMVRPDLQAINTGYVESVEGPLSSTTVQVRVVLLPMDVGAVYVKEKP